MNKNEASDKLAALAHEMLDSQPVLASTLFAMAGSILDDSFNELSGIIVGFTVKQAAINTQKIQILQDEISTQETLGMLFDQGE